MPLNPNKCPIGTVGYLRILSTFEFDGFGDDGEYGPFDDFKSLALFSMRIDVGPVKPTY